MSGHYGETLSRSLAQRIAAACATTTIIQGISPEDRVDGMVVFDLAAYGFWVFEAASVAGADGTHLVPTTGTGRWVAVATTASNAATTSAAGLQSAADKLFEDNLHAVKGADLTDASVTITKAQGMWRVLPAATLSQARSITISSVTGTPIAGDQLVLTRLDQTAFALTIIDGGAGTPTLAVLPGGWKGDVGVQFDGTNWFIKRIGSLAAAATATLPGTMSAAQFNQVTQASPVFHARGVVLANVASLAAFVVAQNGVTYIAGDIVLLAAQTTAAECGLYVVGAVAGTAPLTRIAALPAAAVGVNGMTVEVSEGTLHAGSTWKAMATTTGGFVVGTNDPNFYPKNCGGILTLSAGTKTLGSADGLWLFSVTTSTFHACMNTPGGTLTLTTGGYGANSAGRGAGKAGVAAAIVIARVAAGTIDTANTSTVDWICVNW